MNSPRNSNRDSTGSTSNNDRFERVIGYEKTNKKGAGEKVANSLAGLCMGPILILGACLLLWHNEQWAVKTYKSLNEALDVHIEIAATKNSRDVEAYHNQLVHVTDMLQVEDPLVDTDFGVSRKAVSLTRHTEIYQWVEKITKNKVKVDKDTTEIREVVTYTKDWVPQPLYSSDFRQPDGHENVGHLSYNDATLQQPIQQVTLGGVYTLDHALRKQLSNFQDVLATEIQKLPEGAIRDHRHIYMPYDSNDTGGQQQIDNPIEEQTVRIDGETKTLYIVKATGESFSSKERALAAAPDQPAPSARTNHRPSPATNPQIGDVRIHFSEVPCSYVSVMAKLTPNNMLAVWPSQQGVDYNVAILSQGHVSPQHMIASAQSANTAKTWALRLFGWLLNFIAFSMITSIVSTVADISLNWIPFLGPMTLSLINLGLNIANAVLASSLSLIVTSIAWIFYRPLLGGSLLVGSLGLFYTTSQMGSAKGPSPRSAKEGKET